MMCAALAAALALTTSYAPPSAAKAPAKISKISKKDAKAKAGDKKAEAKKGPSKKELKIQRLMHMAHYYVLQEQNFKEAGKLYGKAFKADPTNIKAGLGAALMKRKQGDDKGALKTLQGVAKKNKTNADVWRAQGDLLVQMKQEDKALDAYRQAVAAKASDSDAHRAIYDILRGRVEKGDKTVIPELVKHLQGYLRSTPYRQGIHYKTAQRLLAGVKGGQLGVVLWDGEEAFKLAWTSRRMGAINRYMGQAREKFEQCLKLKPDNQQCHYMLGLIYSSVKASQNYDLDKAKESLRKAPSMPEAWVEMARIMRRDGDNAGATAAVKKALALNGSFQPALLELGILYKLDARDADAIAALTKAYEVNRFSSVASTALGELAAVDPEHKLVQVAFARGQLRGTIFQTEKYKGAMAQLEKRFDGVDASAPEKAVLDEILGRIVNANDIPPEHTLNVQVLNSKIVNAFAAPNGNIYFTKGFFAMLKKTWPKRAIDAEHDVVAHVMAHEITHVLRRHTVRSAMYREATKDAERYLDPMVLTHVTRLHEIEADREGIVYAFMAGYHPRGGIEFMEERGKESEIPTHLSHPTYDERVHYLEEYWSNDVKYAWLSFQFGLEAIEDARKLEETDPGQAINRYKQAITHLQRFNRTLTPSREVSNNLGIALAKVGVLNMAQGESPLNVWQTRFSVERDLALKYVDLSRDKKKTRGAEDGKVIHIPAELRQAVSIFETLVKKHPDYGRARLNLATAYLAVGQPDQAQQTLALLKPEATISAAEVQLISGVVSAERGVDAEAQRAFQVALGSAGTKKAATYNLARLHAKAGRAAQAKAGYQAYVAAYPAGAWSEAAKKAIVALGGAKPAAQ
jgi:predicted Zn-dependent protease